MKKEDKKILIIFIILCLLIVIVIGIDVFKNRSLQEVDRKITYVFENYTYNSILNKGESLFQNAMDLLILDDALDYEQGSFYSINGINTYRKIKSFLQALNTFTTEALEDYMNYKNIIYYEDDYFINGYSIVNNLNYVGSIIEYDSYENNYIYFNSTNYYCLNEKNNYIGILEDIPECDYYTENSQFKILHENNFFYVDDITNLLNIIS